MEQEEIEEKKKKIKELVDSGDYPTTRAEAIECEELGDYLRAGIFWMLISAPRRSAHYLAERDVKESASLFGIPVPEYIDNMMGLQMPKHWINYILGNEKINENDRNERR